MSHIIECIMERSAYRIIDANFNRAREAVRVIEEFCRFALNSNQLTERAKRIRHELSSAISELDAGRLISCRDVPGDVGLGKTVDERLVRVNLRDCLTAGCKRLTEALRALAEVSQMLNRSVAEKIEKLRYTAYTLEKDIVLFSDSFEKFRRVKLYVIITGDLPLDVISLTYKCAVSGADCIQLRAKKVSDDELFGLGSGFVRICKNAGVLSIINDRADIAVLTGADGVHLGQNDLPVEQARNLQSAPLIIGKSTHSLEQLRAACEELPAYAALGPVFATETKPAVKPVGLEYVERATELLVDTGIRGVAVGGINLDNVENVLKAGARTIAVCAAVTKAKDVQQACRALKEKIIAFDKDTAKEG